MKNPNNNEIITIARRKKEGVKEKDRGY